MYSLWSAAPRWNTPAGTRTLGFPSGEVEVGASRLRDISDKVFEAALTQDFFIVAVGRVVFFLIVDGWEGYRVFLEFRF